MMDSLETEDKNAVYTLNSESYIVNSEFEQKTVDRECVQLETI